MKKRSQPPLMLRRELIKEKVCVVGTLHAKTYGYDTDDFIIRTASGAFWLYRAYDSADAKYCLRDAEVSYLKQGNLIDLLRLSIKGDSDPWLIYSRRRISKGKLFDLLLREKTK